MHIHSTLIVKEEIMSLGGGHGRRRNGSVVDVVLMYEIFKKDKIIKPKYSSGILSEHFLPRVHFSWSRKVLCKLPRKERDQEYWSYPAMSPIKHNIDKHVKIYLNVQ